MSDFNKVLELWRAASAVDEDYVLASIVRVDGSSYRKPGARMLLSQGGRRAGTISGGCLEAEVIKQAWWLTRSGPVVKAYSTSFEMDDAVEGIVPYGLGCGGTVHLLLERRATADVFMHELEQAFTERTPLACSVVLEGAAVGQRGFVESGPVALRAATADALAAVTSSTVKAAVEGVSVEAFAEFIPPRCGLFVFGAGDDAQPLVAQASTMGWQITVADGRSHLATTARFPEADRVVILKDSNLSGLAMRSTDAAVIMTHSFEQDKKLLTQLLARSMFYLGALGPRYRTVDLVKHAVQELGGVVDEWMQQLHSPVGLDLGGDSPATIALSIVAEIQAILRKKPIMRMQELRIG